MDIDFETLEEFSKEEHKQESKEKPEKKSIVFEEEEEVIPDTAFRHEKELYEGREIADIKYGVNDEKKTYTIEPDSVLNPKHKLNLIETILVKKEGNTYEQKTIEYTCINHYVFTKLLCEKLQQNKIITLKDYDKIREYFQKQFNQCRIKYEDEEKEEYKEIRSGITQKRIPIRIYDKKIVKGKEKWVEKEIRIDISLINYIIDKYKYALEYILNKQVQYLSEFRKALLATGDYDIIYRDPDALFYTKTNRGFMFEFNTRLDNRNIYGQVLQSLREKIKEEQEMKRKNDEQLQKFDKFYKKKKIQEFFKNELNIVISDLKYFFQYLVSIAFPATDVKHQSAYTMWENENIRKLKDDLKGLDEKEREEKLQSIWNNLPSKTREKYEKREGQYWYTRSVYTDTLKETQKELELRQNEKYGFFLTPDMVNYVIKEIMLSKVSLSEPNIVYEPLFEVILNKLDKEFNVLKNEKDSNVEKYAYIFYKQKNKDRVKKENPKTKSDEIEKILAKEWQLIRNDKKAEQYYKLSEKKENREQHKNTKQIIASIIWAFLYNSFEQIRGDSDDVKEIISIIENQEEKLLQKKCGKSLIIQEGEIKKNKELSKVRCVIDAITYVMITIMDWNEFTEITENEIKTTILIIGHEYMTDKKKTAELFKSRENVNVEIINLLKRQIDEYELSITDDLLNRLANTVENILSIGDDNVIWKNIMLYAHKF